MCEHEPSCASFDSAGACTAKVAVDHPDQGWHLLCNGVICFYDGGAILPDGQVRGPRAA